MAYANRDMTEKENRDYFPYEDIRKALIVMSDEDAEVSNELARSLRMQGLFVDQAYGHSAGNTYLHHQDVEILIVGNEYEQIADRVRKDPSKKGTLVLAVSTNGVQADMKFPTNDVLAKYVGEEMIPKRNDMYMSDGIESRLQS